MSDILPTTTEPVESTACPVLTAGILHSIILPSDNLLLPRHRGTVVQYSKDDAGVTELHLYLEGKELSFDEPDLFAFGEMLAKLGRFTAGDATRWGNGYDWPRIRDLLQQLLDAGVLVHAADLEQHSAPAADAILPSPLPPSSCPVARSWDQCEAITRELAGRPVELAYLELIIPIFRVAHIYLDADLRQVGEANVFPAQLRLDVPTEWRTCNLPGTRYQSPTPMNVTAMRVMRAHWPQMMAAMLRVRQGYLQRFPDAADAWTVGHLERLTTAVLALPSYPLMRRHQRIANGDLHPALASLFRVTDGVRMTTHQMLLMPIIEAAWLPDQAVTVDDVLDYAERNYSFHSSHGVCAGPRMMVRELLQVLLQGRGNADYASVVLEPAVEAALDDLDIALDYAFHGLRAYGAVFSLWPTMTRAYAQIAAAVDAWPTIDAPAAADLRSFMLSHAARLLQATYLATERWRIGREEVYADMYRQCGRGLAGFADAPGLDVLLQPTWTDADRRTEAALRDLLRCRFQLADATHEPFVLKLSGCVMDFLLRAQAVLRTASAAQDHVNQVLGRDPPTRALDAADINVHNLIQGDDPTRLPYLNDELERLLGIRIELDSNRLAISSRQEAA